MPIHAFDDLVAGTESTQRLLGRDDHRHPGPHTRLQRRGPQALRRLR